MSDPKSKHTRHETQGCYKAVNGFVKFALSGSECLLTLNAKTQLILVQCCQCSNACQLFKLLYLRRSYEVICVSFCQCNCHSSCLDPPAATLGQVKQMKCFHLKAESVWVGSGKTGKEVLISVIEMSRQPTLQHPDLSALTCPCMSGSFVSSCACRLYVLLPDLHIRQHELEKQ